MATLTPAAIEIYRRYSAAYNRVRRELVARPWFADGWAFHAVIFADGVGLQLYKLHWYNHLGRGLHIESWISREQLERRRVAMVLHAESDLPNRAAFREAFWPRAHEVVAPWEGYRAHPANRMQLVTGFVPLVRSRLAEDVTREFERLRSLGPLIDEALALAVA